jgi:Protein of unknown function (DUF1350)
MEGNFILRPPGRARAVIHFIGGAFVGAAPHIAYSTLLERLVGRGYCVVATPYDLSLDYLETTSQITERWEAVETELALAYGTVPVIGVGHSAGALFHSIASSLFDESSPKAGNILISFNNKKIKDAIPLYDLLVTPVARQSILFENSIPKDLRTALESLPGTLDAAIEGSLLTPQRVKEDLLPLAQDARRVIEQLRPLIQELGGVPRETAAPVDAVDGAARPASTLTGEFYPPPADIKIAVSNMYCVEQTLVVKFSSDAIDESESLLSCLQARALSSLGTSVSTMIELSGSHATPLVQDLPGPGAAGEGIGDFGPLGAVAMGVREALSMLGTKEMYTLESLIDEWIVAGIANDTL